MRQILDAPWIRDAETRGYPAEDDWDEEEDGWGRYEEPWAVYDPE